MSSPKASSGSPPKTGSGSPSKTGSSSPTKTRTGSPRNAPQVVQAKEEDEGYYTRPDFIYGGPFIPYNKPSPFIETATPINVQLQGTFKRSFAYFSLKDRLPVILTKVIDYCSREGSKIKGECPGVGDGDIQTFIGNVAKLKNDLITNKDFDPLTEESDNAKKWNEWIANEDNKKYFNCPWIFSECYVYRRLKEAANLTKGLSNFDYFGGQKRQSFQDNLETMCIVADRVVTMVVKSEKDKRKADFVTLLKVCLWANKCDLSLSLGERVTLAKKEDDKSKENAPPPPPPPPPPPAKGKKGKGKKAAVPTGPLVISSDPFQMILDLKDRVLVDDSGKIADQVVTKAENINKAIRSNTTFKFKCSCHRLAKIAGVPICRDEDQPLPEPEPKKEGKKGKEQPKAEAKEETKAEATEEGKEEKKETPPKIPCPAKMTIAQAAMFDIICDNAGYELFADLCLAHFLVSQKIVQKIRFHVKNMPWFVSDVTPADFHHVIDACKNANFSKEKPAEGEGEAKVITSDNLRALGEQWAQLVDDGTFVVMDEEFWTTPKVFKDMKKCDYNMYRKLQYAVAVMYKGDLNYRKLLGDRNCNPVLGFEAAMQGYIPCPAIAVRTVKSEVICGLPRGRWDMLNKINEKWMQTGDYGMIQYCPKGEALKVADRPCVDYCKTCFGVICPEHTDI